MAALHFKVSSPTSTSLSLMICLMTIDNDLFQSTEQQVAAEQSWHANEHALKQLQFARAYDIDFVIESAAFNWFYFYRAVSV